MCCLLPRASEGTNAGCLLTVPDGCALKLPSPLDLLHAGMAACLPCKSGTYPTKSVGTLPGNDQCTACSGNGYRPASSTRWAALTAEGCTSCWSTRAIAATCISLTPCPLMFSLQRDVPGVHRGARGAAQRLLALRGVVSGMRCNWRCQQLCKTALGGTRACCSCLKLSSR